MWYIVYKKEIKVDLSENLVKKFYEDTPVGAELSDDNKTLTIECNGEGFNEEDLEIYLKCATKKGKFDVYMEDHEGSQTYTVAYGPGFYNPDA